MKIDLTNNWPFTEPRDCAVIVTREVLDGAEPVLEVLHGLDAGDWSLHGATHPHGENGHTITLEEAVARDPMVLELADLPPGFHASRTDAGAPWKRHRIPGTLPDDPWGLDTGVTPKDLGGALFQSLARWLRKL